MQDISQPGFALTSRDDSRHALMCETKKVGCRRKESVQSISLFFCDWRLPELPVVGDKPLRASTHCRLNARLLSVHHLSSDAAARALLCLVLPRPLIHRGERCP